MANVERAAGPVVAGQCCEVMLRLATAHLLTGHGPVAARAALCRVWADLQAEVAALNAGSATLN